MILARLNVILGFLVMVGLFYLDRATPLITSCVVVLVGLITASFVRMKKLRNVSDAADSLYFLGFITTIVSLYVAFRTISRSLSPDLDPTTVVTQLFWTIGSGLATTIAGLIMREFIYLVGSRQPEVTIDNVTDNHIQSVIEKMNAALQLGAEAVEVSRIAAGSADAYRATFDAYSQSLSEYQTTMRSFQSEVAQPLHELKAELSQTVSTLAGHAGSIGKSLVELKADLTTTSQQMNLVVALLPSLSKEIPESLQAMRDSADSATAAIDRLVQATTTISTTLDGDFEDIAAISQALPKVAAGMAGLSAGARDLANAGPAMSALERQMIEFAGAVPPAFDGVKKNSQDLGERMSDLTARFDGLLTTLNRDYENLKTIADKLPSERIWKPIEYLGDMMPSLSKQLKSSAQTLDEASRRLESTSQAFTESQRHFAAHVAAMDGMSVLTRTTAPDHGHRSGARVEHDPPLAPAMASEAGAPPPVTAPLPVVRRPKSEVIVPEPKRGVRSWFGGRSR